MIEITGPLEDINKDHAVYMNGQRVGFITSYSVEAPIPRVLYAGLGDYVEIYNGPPNIKLRMEIELHRWPLPQV